MLWIVFLYFCDVSKPSANVWNIFHASTGDFLAVCVGRGGWINVKYICHGAKQCKFVMFRSPQPMFAYIYVCVGAKQWMFMDVCNVSKSLAYVWNILQAKSWLFFVTRGGGGIVKLICQGTNQCIFVMFPSPQPMFGIYFRLVLVIFLLQEGGEKCKIDMSGYQTMHICDVLKPSANVWNISG